ncbi:MAG: AAA family ATPase [Bryobacterales bacterium]|nr:AAA family ATPase [Bryobacterales bacterium]
MNERAIEESLELELTDFGPIARAKVDLRPLTVFVGPSNTGKSYLAILIYALHRFFSRDPRFPEWRFRGRFPLFVDPGRRELSDETVSVLLDMARSLAGKPRLPSKRKIVLPPQVAEALRSSLDKNADALASEIGRCFGIGTTRALVRKGRTEAARVILRRRMSNDSESVEHALTLARQTKLRTNIPADVPIPLNYLAGEGMNRFLRRYSTMLDEEDKWDANRRRFAARDLLAIVGDMVLPSTFGPLHLPAYYLPADRTGVMHAHSVVVSALIASAPTEGLRPAARTPMLSGVLADFLEQLIEINRPDRLRQKRKSDLGREIEKGILGGSVRVDRSTSINYPRFAYRPEGWKDDLALANASSMVSELAPVVLYLRHMVEPGNVLIVEEPESHLHPAMQVEFTRQLAALVNAGIRVIVTTHSEWLLEELANVVRRSAFSRAERGNVRVGNFALRPDQVGAWLFEPRQRPKGSLVKEIHLDDSGMFPTGYDAVAAALHNDWAELSSQIGASS